MKLNSLVKQEVDSNLSGESFNFGIKDTGVIIEILRNRLYSHPIQTLVQEYISNARDANRESGKSNQEIYVTMPTESDPTFKVRDAGPGLSPERIKDVFIYYGTSTKRKDNNQTGGFGIGAKSAWAYTDSFVIVSYFNGTATHYLAHIGKTNEGTLEVLKSHKTTEPNGTEIQIGVLDSDIENFVAAAQRATFFWDVRPSFVNANFSNEIYNTLKPNFSHNNFKIYDVQDLNEVVGDISRYNPIIFVIDGVPYPIDGFELAEINSLEQILNQKAMAIHVGNDFCDVSASREAIADSALSKKQIAQECKNKVKEINSFCRQHVRESRTLVEFMERYESVYNSFCIGRESFKKNFGPFEFEITNPNGTIKSDFFNHFEIERYKCSQARRSSTRRFTKEKFEGVKILECKNFVLEDETLSPLRTKQKLKQFLTTRQKNESLYFLKPMGTLTNEVKAVLNELNAHDLSLLSIAVNANPNRVKRTNLGNSAPTNYNIVGINKITCGYRQVSTEHVQIDTSNLTAKDKFLYLTKSEYETQKNDQYQLILTVGFFQSQGFTVVVMADRFIEWTKTDSHFTSLTSYVSSLTPKDLKKMMPLIEYSLIHLAAEEIDGAGAYSDQKCISLVTEFSKYKSDGIKNSTLKPFFNKISKLKLVVESIRKEKKNRAPTFLLAYLMETYPSMEAFKTGFVGFFKHIEKNYSIVYDIVENNTIDKNKIMDLIVFMNAKKPARSK